MQYAYFAQLIADPGGGYLATFADVPEAIAHGDSREQALEEAHEALLQGLRTYPERGLGLPQPASKAGTIIHIGPHDAIKLAVLDAFTAAKISKTELAEILGKNEGEARRILDPDHATKLPMLEAALAALGRRLVVSVEAA